MKRRLIVEIESEDEMCGECPRANGARCGVFGVGRTVNSSHEFVRLTGCLAAEAAVNDTESEGVFDNEGA